MSVFARSFGHANVPSLFARVQHGGSHVSCLWRPSGDVMLAGMTWWQDGHAVPFFVARSTWATIGELAHGRRVHEDGVAHHWYSRDAEAAIAVRREARLDGCQRRRVDLDGRDTDRVRVIREGLQDHRLGTFHVQAQ